MERIEAFKVLKLRGLVIWMLLFVLIPILAFIISEVIDDPMVEIIFGFLIYSIIVIWILRCISKLQLEWKVLLGSFPRHYQWWKLILIVIFLLFFSTGTFILTFYGLSFVLPSFAYSSMSEKEYLTASQTAFPLIYNVCNILLGVLIAPVVEELLFRGFILHRFTVKWNSKYAIFISSLLFGLIHFDIIGKSVFSFFMAILYIKSRSLFVPIIAHVVHNVIVLWIRYPSSNVGNASFSMEQYRSLVWIGFFILCITVPFIIFFMRKNWPKQDLKLPYFA